MKYENKTNEELIELLEERDQKAEELSSELKEAIQAVAFTSYCEVDSSENIEKSFYAGLESSRNLTQTPLKAWLNFKMENRL